MWTEWLGFTSFQKLPGQNGTRSATRAMAAGYTPDSSREPVPMTT